MNKYVHYKLGVHVENGDKPWISNPNNMAYIVRTLAINLGQELAKNIGMQKINKILQPMSYGSMRPRDLGFFSFLGESGSSQCVPNVFLNMLSHTSLNPKS